MEKLDPQPVDSEGPAPALVDVVAYFEQLSDKHLDALMAEKYWEPETLAISYVTAGDVLYVPPATLITEKALNNHSFSLRCPSFAVNERTRELIEGVKFVKQGWLGINTVYVDCSIHGIHPQSILLYRYCHCVSCASS